MKAIKWVDEHGQNHRSLIKDTDPPEMARYGIPAEPPDIITRLDWTGLQSELRNVLLDQELLTWADVQRNQAGFQAALGVFKRALISVFRTLDNETKSGGKQTHE